ncbi:MAG: biopolymer transporter ExbD [Bacteroidia bacterium]|nr:biopolymer transporter ExbD [Bacteroidia bacterium]
MATKSKSPKLDMNPVVDVAFLLLTFFMLTTTLKTAEPFAIENPTSFAENKVPEIDIMIITIAADGQIYFTMDGKFHRQQVYQMMLDKYGLTSSELQMQKFGLISSFGLPMDQLPEFLDLDQEGRNSYPALGIPCDSVNNQLADWIKFGRMVNPKVRVAVNGDADTRYPNFKKVVNTLLELRIQKFNLITNLEPTEEG